MLLVSSVRSGAGVQHSLKSACFRSLCCLWKTPSGWRPVPNSGVFSRDRVLVLLFEDRGNLRPCFHKNTIFLYKGCENPVIESNSTKGRLRFRRLIQHQRSAKLKIGSDLIIQGRLTPDTTVTMSLNHPGLLKF